MSTTGKQSIKDQIASALKTTMSVDVKSIHQELLDIQKNEWNSIPEHIFKQEFLKLYTEKVEDSDLLDKWIMVVGNIRFGLHVHSEETKERLFTAPPLMDTSSINPSTGISSTDSMAGHLAVFDRLSQAKPMVAMQYFQNQMGRILENKLNNHSPEYVAQYRSMMAYYGFTEKTTTPNSVAKDTLMYTDDDILS